MFRVILAYLLIATGVAGILLPIIPGIPLLIIGVGLLDPGHWLRRRVSSLLHRLSRKRSS